MWDFRSEPGGERPGDQDRHGGGHPGLESLEEGTVPYSWPYDGALDPARLALVVAGADQRWADRCVDTAAARAAVDRTVAMVRHHRVRVVILRHGSRHEPPGAYAVRDVGSCGAANGRSRHSGGGRFGGDRGREPLAVRPGPTDTVVEAGGIDGFFGSSLDSLLRGWGCTHLAVAGFGLEGPVHSTLRSANDRGYECLLLADACAPLDEQTQRGALSTVTMSGGIFGAVGTVAQLVTMLEAGHGAELGADRL